MTSLSHDPLYPMWEQRFSEEQFVYGTEANEFVRQQEPRLARGSKVLCVAEGEGRNAVYLAGMAHQVTTWDYAEAAIRKQHQLAALKQVQLIATEKVDLREAQWPQDAWDAVVAVFAHFERPTRLNMLRGMAGAVQTDGWVIVEVYAKQQLAFGTGGPKQEDWLYELSDFTQVFDPAAWRVAHLFSGEVWRAEGALHQGWSHVIQLAAQKKG